MAKNINNINNVINDIKQDKIHLLGLGCFSYGAANYWLFMRNMVKKISRVKNQFDIFIEEPYPYVSKLNRIIHGHLDLKLGNDYSYLEYHPLKGYVKNIGYDSTDFLQFLNLLETLIQNGNKINIYGVGCLLTENDLNLIKDDDERKGEILKFYPELNNTELSINQKMLKLNYGIKDPHSYTYEMINHLSTKHFGLFIGHINFIHNFKLSNYETTGFKLKNALKNKYIMIGTSGAEGELTFTGEIKPKVQRYNTKTYSIYEIYEKPQHVELNDSGSLQRYVQNRIKSNNKIIFLKPMKDSDLSYYRSGQISFNMEADENYNRLNSVDYHIFFNKVSPTNHIVVPKKEEPIVDPKIFTKGM